MIIDWISVIMVVVGGIGVAFLMISLLVIGLAPDRVLEKLGLFDVLK